VRHVALIGTPAGHNMDSQQIAVAVMCCIYVHQFSDKSGEGPAAERQRDDALELARCWGWEVVCIQSDMTSAAGRR
jgi:hypothetical protein